jgi:hypothetical protein
MRDRSTPYGGTGAEPPSAQISSQRFGGHSQRSARQGGPALESMYQLILWLVPTIEKFPRSQKFLLGDRLQNEALAVLDLLINATYSRDRDQTLRAVNLGLERMRYGIRLARDLRFLSNAGYEHAARGIDGVGRLVGGWIKADRAGSGSTHAPTTP